MTAYSFLSLALLVPAGFAVAACSDCGARTVSVAQEKARESRDLVDAPGTLRMHAPVARFFRTNGDVRRFKATVGFDPAIYTLKRKWGPTHVAATKMGFKVYADGKLVADAGIMRPGDGTKTIEADVSGARMIALESVDGGYWLGTPQLLARDILARLSPSFPSRACEEDETKPVVCAFNRRDLPIKVNSRQKVRFVVTPRSCWGVEGKPIASPWIAVDKIARGVPEGQNDLVGPKIGRNCPLPPSC